MRASVLGIFPRLFLRMFLSLLLVSVCKYGQKNENMFVLSYQLSPSYFYDSSSSSRLIPHSSSSNNMHSKTHSNMHRNRYYTSLYSSLSNDGVAVTDTKRIKTEQKVEQKVDLNGDMITNKNNYNDNVINNNDNKNDGDEVFLDLPSLEIIEFDRILNFRSALPGTGLPIYRCAALDNATAADSLRLLGRGMILTDLSGGDGGVNGEKEGTLGSEECVKTKERDIEEGEGEGEIIGNKGEARNIGEIGEIGERGERGPIQKIGENAGKAEKVEKDIKGVKGLNLCSIIDLRNTDEIILAYKYRSYEGAVSLYSFFKIVLDTATSLKMNSKKNTFYARSFDSVVRDRHYSAVMNGGNGGVGGSSFSNSLYQSQQSQGQQMGQQMGQPGQAAVQRKPTQLPRNVFELPFFGESEEFWTELKEITVKAGSSSFLADFRWLFNPQALNKQLTANLAQGGLPLLYEVMLEVSASRIASALFLCLAVCEDHVAWLEREGDRRRKVEREIEREKEREIEREKVRLEMEGKRLGEGLGDGQTDKQIVGPIQVTVQTDGQAVVSTSTYSGSVLFHCAQGKDRTGILSMLLTFSLYGDNDETEERAVREYAASEPLLEIGRERERIEKIKRMGVDGEDDDGVGMYDDDIDTSQVTYSYRKRKEREEKNAKIAEKNRNKNKNGENNDGNTNLGEIQSLKGSPPQALRDTLSRVRARYGGSVLGYLDNIGFNAEYRKRLIICAEKSRRLTSTIL